MHSSKVRQAFLDFFKKNDHQIVASGSLVPSNDPTLMFTNAGMVPFKDVFTGREKREYKRATSSQKCIRISGKHNDLENVGVTARHHTFFEMLGNFSFGDYFKEKAILYGWEFITQELKLPKDKLIVTVFEGDANAPRDEEAETLWRKISGLPDERIVRMGAKDNFWQMGDTGPCGPCSEIHIFLGDGTPDVKLFGEEPTSDGKGWVELWNLVFMQFDRQNDGTLVPLPAPCIDTGAGLERLSAVAQGVLSNYDTDLLRPLIDEVAAISKKTYRGTLEHDDVSMRVVADHARMTAFLMAEGVFPDRDGREYVLRRVMRRAIRHGHRLGLEENFFDKIVLKVADLMKAPYPELDKNRAILQNVTEQEETRFRQTLKRGLELLERNQEWEKSSAGKKTLPGKVAFTLYDTYGFPLDLQDVIGEEQGFAIDHAGFNKAMEGAREKSAGSKVGDKAVDEIYQRLMLDKVVGVVDDSAKYDEILLRATVQHLIRGSEGPAQLSKGEEGEVILDKTNFYAEAGGQVGDQGVLRSESGVFRVTDTVKPVEGLIVHRGFVESGVIKKNEIVVAEYGYARRQAIRRNHSATHLLHKALELVVGEHATQKGSLVAPDKLRFDYSHGSALTQAQLEKIEDLVNERILKNLEVPKVVPIAIDEAKKLGAKSMFGEKYGEFVRVLKIDDSIEFCGGTHVSRTGDIGFFKILGDMSIAAGVRRIEAVTGAGAFQYARELEHRVQESARLMKAAPGELVQRVEKLLFDQKTAQKEIESLKRKLASGEGSDVGASGRKVGDVFVLGAAVSVGDVDTLRSMAESLRDKHQPAVVLLGTQVSSDKVALVCAVSKAISVKYHAGKLIKEAASVVGGSGGGRPDFAQAGGADVSKLEQAVASVYQGVQ